EILFSVSATTRPQRATEVNGKDYFFITREAFQQKIRDKELVEWEQIYDDFYGTPEEELRKAATAGKPLLLDVDVKGALSIKNKYPAHSMLLFIKPPSMEVLKERLMNRRTESPETLQKRMNRAAMEMEQARRFDHTITNDILKTAIDGADLIIVHLVSVPIKKV
ncbi:MAG TPA: guanylate kinase, partial [Bacteroidota bacterium]|nr:guanylate kinase [Bacteroidota bacterium]